MVKGLGPQWRLLKALVKQPSLMSMILIALRGNFIKGNDIQHAHVAIDWLLRDNQTVAGCGFAGVYSLSESWGTAYPETSGYIIPTLFNFSRQDNYRREEIILACRQTGEWLVEIQNQDGSYNGYQTFTRMIFDTSQVMLGLIALYHQFDTAHYLERAIRVGDWIVSQQANDGSWVKHSFGGQPHAYYTLVDSALIDLGKLTGNDKYIISAKKHLDWVVAGQQPNGWFKYSSFTTDDRAILHTIAYTLQGLIAAGKKLPDEKYYLAAKQASDKLLDIDQTELLRGYYNSNWEPQGVSRCLTGLAQMGAIWGEMSSERDDRYSQAAGKIWQFLIGRQCLSQNYPDIYGSLPGSWPVWGEYLPWSYPNWGVKYFLDLYLTISK